MTSTKREHNCTSSSDEDTRDTRYKKQKVCSNNFPKKKTRHKRRHSASSSTSLSSSTSSRSSSCDTSSDSSVDYSKKHKKHKKTLKKSKYKSSKKAKKICKHKKSKHKKNKKEKKSTKSNKTEGITKKLDKNNDKIKNIKDEGCSNDIPIDLMDKSMMPMTKEQWEKQQSVVKRVYDDASGRYRLIKGDGEVIEEIVSRDRHKQINQTATRADGEYYQANLKHLNIQK